MSFLVAAALAIAALVLVPVIAHWLRRGRAEELEFPPTHWVPASPPLAQRRNRIEDGVLLSVRGALILALAVLGAVPLVRCSRLSIDRDQGASVAIALVVDDSLSMRLRSPTGEARWDRALAELNTLLGSAREGDAFSLILAGHPARLTLAATTDLAAVRHAVRALSPSDRATDLATAVQLARGSLQSLPHTSQRVLLFSDLEGEEIPQGKPSVLTAVPELAQPHSDCAISSATLRGQTVSVTVVCNSLEAAQGRRLRVQTTADSQPLGNLQGTEKAAPGSAVLAEAPISTLSGLQTVVMELRGTWSNLSVQLDGRDSLASDDQAAIASEPMALSVGVVVDAAHAGVATGGTTVVEQALKALEGGTTLRPLALIPDQEGELTGFSALVLDDPTAFGPEVRAALLSWMEQGGVGLALLGPGIGQMQLGASVAPFGEGLLRFAATAAQGVDPKSVAWLGPDGASLVQLGAQHRVELEDAAPRGSQIRGRWSDGRVFLMEHRVGRGLAIACGLPGSTDHSDFAFRPGFLAILEYVIQEAGHRTGKRVTEVGVNWTFPAEHRVEIQKPDGSKRVLSPSEVDGVFTPEHHGRYRVSVGTQHHDRVATLNPRELLQPAARVGATSAGLPAAPRATDLNVSREIAGVVAGLFVIELMIRALQRWWQRGPRQASTKAATP